MFSFKKKLKPRFLGQSLSDFPSIIKGDIVYLIGEKKCKWVAAFICPCGCKEVIQLNLLKEGSVCWKVTLHRDRSVTIRPSVWRTTGCRSHFTIRRGQLNWFGDLSDL